MQLSTDPIRRDSAARHRLVQSDFACILMQGLKDREAGRGSLPECLGLMPAQLRDLADTLFVGLELPDLDAPDPVRTQDQEAIAMLLLWRGGSRSVEAHWLAAIIARRAMEPHHLWEDLGLPSRSALSDLMSVHFPRLHAANSQNMRWKKFFYRQICADHEFALCLSPTCDECEEYIECFAAE